MQSLPSQAFKKYKSTVPKGYNSIRVELPDFVKMVNRDQASTEEIMIEISRVKNMLLVETNNYLSQS